MQSSNFLAHQSYGSVGLLRIPTQLLNSTAKRHTPNGLRYSESVFIMLKR
jgi:hypothetical protein